jgi:hypothetical protein
LAAVLPDEAMGYQGSQCLPKVGWLEAEQGMEFGGGFLPVG